MLSAVFEGIGQAIALAAKVWWLIGLLVFAFLLGRMLLGDQQAGGELITEGVQKELADTAAKKNPALGIGLDVAINFPQVIPFVVGIFEFLVSAFVALLQILVPVIVLLFVGRAVLAAFGF